MKIFDIKQKSSFPYWYHHWLEFQQVGFKYKCWRPWYIFHDMAKPFLLIFLPYKKVQKIHRKYSFHHPESVLFIDYTALVIDWECSYISPYKPQCRGNAYSLSFKYGDKILNKTHYIINKYKFPQIITHEKNAYR